MFSFAHRGSGVADSKQFKDWVRTNVSANSIRGRPYALVRTQSGGVAAAVDVDEPSLGQGHDDDRLLSPGRVAEHGGGLARVREKEEVEGDIELVGHFV